MFLLAVVCLAPHRVSESFSLIALNAELLQFAYKTRTNFKSEMSKMSSCFKSSKIDKFLN